MKKILSVLFIAGAVVAFGQPKGKEAKMAPTMVKGYYLTLKGDTVRGEIQANSEDPTGYYQGFFFRPGSTGKVAAISSKKAKGYGFEGRSFVMAPFNGADVYIESLVKGRLNFFEYKFHDTKEGAPVISSHYFVQDTRAEETEKELKELKQISLNFYKKDLKAYMKDQAMIWSDLDKFVFNKVEVVKAIKEFNKFYDQ